MSQSLAVTIIANSAACAILPPGSKPQAERIVLHSVGIHPAQDLRGDFFLTFLSHFSQSINVELQKLTFSFAALYSYVFMVL